MADYYEVSMETPLGKYDGILKLVKDKEKALSGEFEIMDSPSEISGLYDSEGNVEFSGKLNTALISSEYSVRGKIEGSYFYGIMETKNGEYILKPSKKKPNPEKLTEEGNTFSSVAPIKEEIDVNGANNS